MEILSYFTAAGGALLLAATVPGSLALAALTIAGVLPRRRLRPVAGGKPSPRIAVVVPAHDEGAVIDECLRSLRRCAGLRPADIVVVADNCSDDTARRSAAAGVRVLERRDPERRGKAWALDFAFRQLQADYDAIAVVDADSVVSPGLVREIGHHIAAGADAVQVRYTALRRDASQRARLLGVALMAFNVLRPSGRDRLGLSAGLFGNGFALTTETLAAVPYDTRSVTEDLDYHLQLVRAGRRVTFCDTAEVRGDMPGIGVGAGSQRARWEGGRLRAARQHLPGLLGAVARGRLRLLEPALDLLLLPLAFHAGLLLLCLAWPSATVSQCGAAGLLVLTLHVAAALDVGEASLRDLRALAIAPGYLAWKLLRLPATLLQARGDAPWVRTARAGVRS